MSIQENSSIVHYAECPAHDDPALICLCSDIESQQIKAESDDYRRISAPSAAEMMRNAKAKGLISPQPGYV